MSAQAYMTAIIRMALSPATVIRATQRLLAKADVDRDGYRGGGEEHREEPAVLAGVERAVGGEGQQRACGAGRR